MKSVVRRFFSWWKETPVEQTAAAEPRPDREASGESPEIQRAIRWYLEGQSANMDRALRFKERAERLEDEGTPSESARNKAERARQEVTSGISALRSELVGARGGESEVGRYFDREVERICPDFKPPDITSARPS